MKHGKAPTVAQKKLMREKRLDPDCWLVVKNQPDRMEIVHRFGPTRRVIVKETGREA